MSGSPAGPVNYGRSVTYQITYARKLKQGDKAGLWLEFPALAGPSHSINTGNGALPTSLATFYATPSFRAVLAPRTRLSPWASFGGGYTLFETSETLANGASNPIRLTNSAALQLGGGLDIKTPIHFLVPIALRVEVRDFYALSIPAFGVAVTDQKQHNVTASGGLILRF